MRSILVYADRSPAMEPRLQSALALARSFGGHVTVLIDTPTTRYIAMDPMGGSYLSTEALTAALEEDDRQAAALEARLARDDVPFDIVRSDIEAVPALATAARLADLTVVSRSSGLAGELALSSRTPVLVLPDDRTLAAPLARAVVAWDGGDEAALALRLAAPLLASAGAVQVLTVEEKPSGLVADDALRYLARHGVSAELVELKREGTTEATLARAVADAGTDLLVMGAYGRSRLREYLFGGVTRHFIEDATAPALLLAH
jgi:nucleotide-binding universal stress UspA family protein